MAAKKKRLIVAAGVKAHVHDLGFKMNSDVAEAIEIKLQKVIDYAVLRAKENGRKTVRGIDI